MVERAIRCPYCGETNELHDAGSGAAPEEGDGSICWSCKEISKFTADGGLRPLEGEELEWARQHPQARAVLGLMQESYDADQVVDLLRIAHAAQSPHGQKCRETIKMLFQDMLDEMAATVEREPQGSFTVTTFRVVAPSFDEAAFDCPHGITYWVAPDADLQKWFLRMSDAQVRRWQQR